MWYKSISLNRELSRDILTLGLSDFGIFVILFFLVYMNILFQNNPINDQCLLSFGGQFY